MVHINCGGIVIRFESGNCYCMNCGQNVPENEIAYEYVESEDNDGKQ